MTRLLRDGWFRSLVLVAGVAGCSVMVGCGDDDGPRDIDRDAGAGTGGAGGMGGTGGDGMDAGMAGTGGMDAGMMDAGAGEIIETDAGILGVSGNCDTWVEPVAGHQHPLVIPAEDVALGEETTYTLPDAEGHTHEVTFTEDDFEDVVDMGFAEVQSTEGGDDDHQHFVRLECTMEE